LQALVNFVRIHAKTITIPFKKAKKRVQPGDSDSMITALINQGNKLQQVSESYCSMWTNAGVGLTGVMV
jgi:hypothetical protein